MRSSMIATAPPAQPDYVGLTKEVREPIFEILCMNWRIMGLDKMIQALQSGSFLVDHVEVYRILQSDPRYTVVPAGSNDEIEVSLVLRQWLVSIESNVTLEELVAWNRP